MPVELAAEGVKHMITSIAELNATIEANTTITGFGLDTTMHAPCPFCGAPDFMVYRIIDSREAMAKGGTCTACKRSMRGIVQSNPLQTQVSFVQTGGDDLPDWYEPKVPRSA